MQSVSTPLTLDSDGNVDVTFPVCLPGKGDCTKRHEIRVLFNIQRRTCTSLFDRVDCRPEDALCTADDNFTFADPAGVAGEACWSVLELLTVGFGCAAIAAG